MENHLFKIFTVHERLAKKKAHKVDAVVLLFARSFSE